jgi:hypothetical protein
MEPNLSQALHLLNGETVNNKIKSGGLVGRLLKEGKTPAQVIEALYMRCFSRKPTGAERAKLETFLKGDRKPDDVLHDMFWAILNSKEFVFNH